MSAIDGIFVSLDTFNQSWAGTDDHVYLGVVGTVGGREFAVAVSGFDDFEPGHPVTYSIGPGARVFGGHESDTASDALDDMIICLPNVTHVYLRKQGDRSHDADDLWRLDSALVFLIAAGKPTRVFTTTGPTSLGNEVGHTVWLAETAHSGSYRDARMVIEGVAACQDD
ncbi:MAG: hypothetical protein OES57_10325 [Acidimicrobiia bacterium]|nr:hypothetical protein [Acidimicrobiia bacterium]